MCFCFAGGECSAEDAVVVALDDVVLPAMQLRLPRDPADADLVQRRGIACLCWLGRSLAMRGSLRFQVWPHAPATVPSVCLSISAAVLSCVTHCWIQPNRP
jgi:hypothetical protein